jgi:NAD(P)-dependent dehydrogenase (short-subunit alcohol dehydrogenase family)
MMMKTSSKRAAIVTGASYGIGHATAIALAKDGFDVAITDLSLEPLKRTIAAIEDIGMRAMPIILDLRDQKSIAQAIDQAFQCFPQIDLLVNNAGIPSLHKLAVDINLEEWQNIIGINLSGTFFMTTQFGKKLMALQHPGSVVSLSSTHGVVGFEGSSAYGITKAGIGQMTKTLAMEWAPHQIRVNAVAPGATYTESRAPGFDNPARREVMLGRIPLKRFGEPEEIAGLISYLASPKASYITGQIHLIDGGLTAY